MAPVGRTCNNCKHCTYNHDFALCGVNMVWLDTHHLNSRNTCPNHEFEGVCTYIEVE